LASRRRRLDGHHRAVRSAGTQLALFEQAPGRSEDRDRALRAVTDWIAEATLQ